LLTDTIKLPQSRSEDLWPIEVDLILSAMDAASSKADLDRRQRYRVAYRVRAELRLFSDPPQSDPSVLYTRDVDPRGIGFITPHRLPLGYGGTIELLAPSGRKLRIECTLFRCRQTVEGWFEGALYFNREQSAFDVSG
jgi:hypothetical protein